MVPVRTAYADRRAVSRRSPCRSPCRSRRGHRRGVPPKRPSHTTVRAPLRARMRPYSTSPCPRQPWLAIAARGGRLRPRATLERRDPSDQVDLGALGEQLDLDADGCRTSLDLAPVGGRQHDQRLADARPRRHRARRPPGPPSSRRAPAADRLRRPPSAADVARAGSAPPRVADSPRVPSMSRASRRSPQSSCIVTRSGPAPGTPRAPRRASGTARSRGPSTAAGPGRGDRSRPGSPHVGRARASRDAGSARGPRSSRTIGRTSKMKDFVASRVCWTIAISWWISVAEAAGSRSTSRSTICAWRTMFVRLCAGPSCIARAISRRRSSWA